MNEAADTATVWVRYERSPIVMAALPLLWVGQLRSSEKSAVRRVFGLVLGSVLIIGSSTVRVVVNRRGLEVGFGPWGWPRRRIPFERIAEARVERLSPLYYGVGFGYRLIPGRSRVVLRPGPGIVVETKQGGSFGVTTRDAERAVDLINDAVRMQPR